MVREQSREWHGTSFDIMMHHMRADHSPVEDVGRIAQKAGVKTLVLSHLTPPARGFVPPDKEWIQGASKYFKGRIVVGHDLMVV